MTYWYQTSSPFETQLRTIPLAGGTPTVLFTLSSQVILRPQVSPDYCRILYMHGPNNFGATNLNVCDADGANDTAFLTSAGDPTWAPSSDEIALILSGTGLVRRTLAGVQTALTNANSAARWPQFTFDGSRIVYLRSNTGGDVYAIDPGNTNNDLLDNEPNSFLNGSRVSCAHLSNMVAYGEGTPNEDYWRILTDGTGKTNCSVPGVSTNPLVAPRVWAPDDSFFVAADFAGATWSEVVRYFADGVTSPDPLGLFFPNAGAGRPQIFGDRIYFIENAGSSTVGKPLVSVALDGSDYRVEDDANGGDSNVTLGLE